jgi:hypothetical protein
MSSSGVFFVAIMLTEKGAAGRLSFAAKYHHGVSRHEVLPQRIANLDVPALIGVWLG